MICPLAFVLTGRRRGRERHTECCSCEGTIQMHRCLVLLRTVSSRRSSASSSVACRESLSPAALQLLGEAQTRMEPPSSKPTHRRMTSQVELQRVSNQIALCKMKGRMLQNAYLRRVHEERKQMNETKELLRLAQKPWLALGVPIHTQPFDVFVHEHTVLNGGGSSSSSAKPLSESALRQWKLMPWSAREAYVVAAHLNKQLKVRLLRRLFSPCQGFEAFCRRLRREVASAQSVRRKMRQLQRRPTAASDGNGCRCHHNKAQGKSAAKDCDAVWRQLVKLEEMRADNPHSGAIARRHSATARKLLAMEEAAASKRGSKKKKKSAL